MTLFWLWQTVTGKHYKSVVDSITLICSDLQPNCTDLVRDVVSFCQENVFMLLHDKRVAGNVDAAKLLLETLQVEQTFVFETH